MSLIVSDNTVQYFSNEYQFQLPDIYATLLRSGDDELVHRHFVAGLLLVRQLARNAFVLSSVSRPSSVPKSYLENEAR